MLCDARELADEIDIPANFELTQPRHTVRRRNVNFDYEARDDWTEDATLKYLAVVFFFTLDKAINAFESRLSLLIFGIKGRHFASLPWTAKLLAPAM
ncbi:uncharacterized protein TNCV_645331 [Trichonephila clavipes]|nr:uncharacterized protein TNCV_645331 [Trichonephila clavipes]